MSNLRLINQTQITSSVSNVNITDVFSADFDIYKIVVNDVSTVGTTSTGLDMQLINASGSIMHSENYAYGYHIARSEQSYALTSGTNKRFLDDFFGVIDQSPEGASSVSYIFNPFQNTRYTFVMNESARSQDTNFRSQKYIGVYKQTESITGFRVLEQNFNRPFNAGVITTYGLRVDT